MMAVYAQIMDYQRKVGIIFTKPAIEPGCIYLGHIPCPDKMLTSIEHQMEWGSATGTANVFVGNESIVLSIEEVQLIFDALWKAGLRSSV